LILLLDEGPTLTKVYRVQDFAKLAGVTVRALHHYDRLGLLRPNRTEAGYRLYYLRDLERLEQIVALKFLGIPLKQIRRMFQRGTSEMSDSLEKQRRVLEENGGSWTAPFARSKRPKKPPRLGFGQTLPS
jgi:DNA-binding transcriptional MerR regulator